MSTILVTGGAGYIGSHACKALHRAGFHPVAFDDLSRGHGDLVRWGPLEVGSLLDPVAINGAFEKWRPVAVMHFAALAYVGESVEEPARYYCNNVTGTLNLLEAMCQHDVKRLVFSSTCATYGVSTSVPIDEAHEQHPINPYGRSKWMVEQVLRDYAEAYALRSIALRYFNAAGADPDGETGEDHVPETHLIPCALAATASDADPLTIHGVDYETPDGTCIRDFVHVSDIAQAHVLALQRIDDGDAARAINLGSGHGYSVKQVLDCVERVTGECVKRVTGPRREGDPAQLVGSAEKAARELAWRPSLSSIDEIVSTAWNWHRKRHGGAA